MTATPRACIWYPACPIRRHFEAGRLAARWVEEYCHGDFRRCVRYRMESRGEAHPDHMLPDGSLDGRLEGF